MFPATSMHYRMRAIKCLHYRTLVSRAVDSGAANLRRRVRLGKTDLMVSAPALGGVGIGGPAGDDGALYGGVSDDQAVETVQRALKRGMNFIDTAPLYAESERRIGLALSTFTEQELRDYGLVLATKVGDECPPYSNNGGHDAMSESGVMSSVENSLKLLQRDSVDILFLHDPTFEEVLFFLHDEKGGMRAIESLKQQGVIKYVGIGCVEHEQQRAFMEHSSPKVDCDVVLTVNDFNLVRRYGATSPGAFPLALERDIGVINAGAFYMGLLADPENSWSMGFKKTLDQPKLIGLAQRMGKWCDEHIGDGGIRTLALQYALRHEAVSTTVIGCRTAQEVDEVCDSMQSDITSDVWEKFDEEFSTEVQALTKKDHWYYDKASADLG